MAAAGVWYTDKAMHKKSRTISGVTPVAVMVEPGGCPGNCVYCPNHPDAPRSYTAESPAVIRARFCGYDAKRQVSKRLETLSEMGHPTDKIELIVMGGTFLSYPEEYRRKFIKDCYDALNGLDSGGLEEAKQRNEKAAHRCVGLCVETRPDWCSEQQIDGMLEYGTTCVELGVQTLDDEIYRVVKRGHKVKDVIEATRALRDCGLKVHYHWMPGLPGSTPQKDLQMSRELFSDQRFRPDGLKIYPTMVVTGSELEQWYNEGRYRPYDDMTMTDLIADIKACVPPYVRISRVLRDIPGKFVIGGLRDSMRNGLKKRMAEQGVECRCIRCREYGHRLRSRRPIGEPKLVRNDYDASEGKEIFLSFEDGNGTLFGLLRMRVQSKPIKGIDVEDGKNTCVVRELHVYGTEVPLNAQYAGAAQHKGLGKALLAEAERIAMNECGSSILAILSGVGAREYYRKEFDCVLQSGYMVKHLHRV